MPYLPELGVSGPVSGVILLSDNFQVLAHHRTIKLDANGTPRVSDATTPIIGGSPGQVVYLVNVGSETITLLDTPYLNTPDDLNVDIEAGEVINAVCTDGLIWHVISASGAGGGGGSLSAKQERLVVFGGQPDDLLFAPVENAALVLYVNGILARQGAAGEYTISGTTITWLDNNYILDASDEVIAYYWV